MVVQTPIIIDDTLRVESPIQVGSPAWYAWLEQHTAFIYTNPVGRFSARKEQNRSGVYWKAYRRRAGKLRRVYLGQAENLTIETLLRAAQELAGALPADPKPSAAPSAPPAPQLILNTSARYAPPPLRSNRLIRTRLLRRLDQALEMPLTLLVAPAGYGKTALLADWVGRATVPVAWLTLDARHEQWSVLLHDIVGALSRVYPEFASTFQFTQEDARQPARLLTLLLNWVEQADHDVVLVLDNLMMVSQHAHFIDEVFSALPVRLHLVLSSRAEPRIALSRMRVQGQILEIRTNDLAFTTDESAEFFNQVIGLGLSTADIVTLRARTEGWIAGLQLAALILQSRNDVSAALAGFSGSHQYVYAYLMDEVLERQEAEIRHFLLYTSLLERMSAPLCDAVLLRAAEVAPQQSAPVPGGTSQAVLERLMKSHLFIVPLDAEHSWYRYHRLFADMLRHRLRQIDPESIPLLHACASAWYEQQGQIPDAVHHALAAADIVRAADLLERVTRRYLCLRQPFKLQQLAEQIPEMLLEGRPWLTILRVWLELARLDTRQAERIVLEYLTGQPSVYPDRDAIQAATLFLRGALAQSSNNLPAARNLYDQAYNALPVHDVELHGFIVIGIAISLSQAQDLKRAQEVLEQLTMQRVPAELTYVVVGAANQLARLCIRRGELRLARQYYEQALRLIEARGLHAHPIFAETYVGLGMIQREQGRFQAAERLLMTSLANEWLELPNTAYEDGAITLARLRQAQGEEVEALTILQRALDDLQRLPVARMLVETYQARLWIAHGNLAAARTYRQILNLRSPDGVSPELHEIEQLTLARLLAAERRFHETHDLLNRLIADMQARATTEGLIDAYILRALTHHAQQQPDPAVESLRDALVLAAPEGYVRVFLDEGVPMADLLTRFIEVHRWPMVNNRVEQEIRVYARQLLVMFVAANPAQSVQMLEPPPPLEESLTDRELEVLHMMADGKSNRQIAATLVVAISTVKSHVNRIFAKLGVHNRVEALSRARQLQLI